MGRRIQHPLHPQHILNQQHKLIDKDDAYWPTWLFWNYCGFCGNPISSTMAYTCSSQGCKFDMHLRCAQGVGVMDATADDEKRQAIIHHPSHPNHELKLWRRRCSFKCDACGTTRKGSSYTCANEACQYLIHERCASLFMFIEREDHHHPLSLSFHVPPEYVKYDFKCDVCSKSVFPQNWIYHCELCRYIVHIKCSLDKPPRTIENDADAKDIIQLPTNEVAEKLITPFVMRHEGEGTSVPVPPIIIYYRFLFAMIQEEEEREVGTLVPPFIISDELVKNVKYKFLHHQHQLNLVSSDHNQEAKAEEEEEEEDEENYGKRWELICDGCITPISSPSSSKYYYMSCSECKYNLHIPCFRMPPRI